MNDGLSEAQHQQLFRVFDSVEWLERVILYGSRARGDFFPHSDIDLALVGDSELLDCDEVKDRLLDTTVPYFFDVIDLGACANQDLLDDIERDGLEFWQRSTSHTPR